MGSTHQLKLTFWGVRGSTPTPEPENLGYGGNTPCLEIRYGDHPVVILDAGSGVRRLGLQLQRECDGGKAPAVNVVFTHFHWDHIQGVPFFAPLYDTRGELTFYSSLPASTLKEIVAGQMKAPFFPVDLSALEVCCKYAQVRPDGISWGELAIYPFPLHHPGGATGYRIEAPQATIVYASDHEHGNPSRDSALRKYAAEADVLVYDAQYTPEEYAQCKGWGHSTWREGVRCAQDAGVKQLILFHHDPEHDDSMITGIVERACQEFENTTGAREGWSIEF